MLEISAAMNSGVEEIFAFKTCCGARAFDQNLEILIKNRGIDPVVVPSYCDLRGIRGTCANHHPDAERRAENCVGARSRDSIA